MKASLFIFWKSYIFDAKLQDFEVRGTWSVAIYTQSTDTPSLNRYLPDRLACLRML